jgi:isopentenyl diphosphate isomerase/L-lactate dehydrogenase-like FMN-dependent dehydrogenase
VSKQLGFDEIVRERGAVQRAEGAVASGAAAMQRARAAKFSALVVTIDTPVAGLRERDIRNGTKELITRKLGARESGRGMPIDSER